jgi:hypothetical protein
MRLKFVVIFGTVMLCACHTGAIIPPEGGPPWKDADDAGVPVYKGADECKYQAKKGAASATGISKQEAVADDLYDSCMRARGY